MENPYQSPESEIEVAVSEDVELASLSSRFWGSIVDGVLGMALMFCIYFISGTWRRIMEADEIHISEIAFVSVFGLLGFAVMHGYTLATRGQTLGKVLLKTQIVSVKDNSILPLWRIFALRYLPLSAVSLVPVVGNIFALVNILFIFRADRRCVHDHIAGTKVVNYVG